jgi:hypothetical protein
MTPSGIEPATSTNYANPVPPFVHLYDGKIAKLPEERERKYSDNG